MLPAPLFTWMAAGWRLRKMKTRIVYHSKWLAALFILILAFTAIDYVFHILKAEWSVLEYYFRNKIIFGFLWGIPALFIAWKSPKLWQKSLIFSVILAVILQARYYLEGYPINFVLIFLLIHFLILLALSFIMFKSVNKLMH